MKKLRTLTIPLVAALALSSIAPASAEGGFISSLSGVRDGFTTRVWNDKNSDTTGTTITASGCRNQTPNSPGRVDFTLRRQRSFRPDTIEGAKPFSACYRGEAKGNWGRVQAGNYYAVLGTHSWNHVSVNHLEVSY